MPITLRYSQIGVAAVISLLSLGGAGAHPLSADAPRQMASAAAAPISDSQPVHPKSGKWTALQNPYPGAFPDLPLLLTDGTVIVHEGCTPDWYKLTPDKNGSYQKGSWSMLASMPSDYKPLYFASQVLPDGRVIVNGGEYNSCSFAETNKGALYDPVANSWTAVATPSGWSSIGAAASVVRTDGVYQLANCCSADSALASISGSKVTWKILTAGHTGKNDDNIGEGWTTLPDQTIFTVGTQNCAQDSTSCIEIFDIGSNMWSDGQRACGQLIAPGNPPHDGPNVLLPNGFVFAAGASTTNCIMNASTGEWFDAPAFGDNQVASNAPAAVLPNGDALIQVSPVIHTPSHFFEIKVRDANTVFVTRVDDPASASNVSSYEGRMLVLPTGQILWTNDIGDIELYTAKGRAKASWAPEITKLSKTLYVGSKNNRVAGKNFNGVTFGGYYGSGAQTASNYPLFRITNTASGHVCYARTHDHNRMGIADGGKTSTKFDIPKSCEAGESALEVVANGIASEAVSATLK